MRQLDLHVMDSALQWARDGHPLWLCTVLSTYGSAPRAPGAMLVARADGQFVGSLSGGCVEEAFLEALARGELQAPAQIVRYGESDDERQRLRLPCGGILQVLVEHRLPDEHWLNHLQDVSAALLGQRRLVRELDLTSGKFSLALDLGVKLLRCTRNKCVSVSAQHCAWCWPVCRPWPSTVPASLAPLAAR